MDTYLLYSFPKYLLDDLRIEFFWFAENILYKYIYKIDIITQLQIYLIKYIHLIPNKINTLFFEGIDYLFLYSNYIKKLYNFLYSFLYIGFLVEYPDPDYKLQLAPIGRNTHNKYMFIEKSMKHINEETFEVIQDTMVYKFMIEKPYDNPINTTG